jgi:cytochrome P450
MTYPEGYTVMVVIPLVNTDSAVFAGGAEFSPNRWAPGDAGPTADGGDATATTAADASTPIFTYGCGPRGCIGQHVMKPLLRAITTMVVTRFDWSITPAETRKLKWLPTMRPVDPVMIKLRPRKQPAVEPKASAEAQRIAHSTML